ncbi:hypothetical protein HPB49_019748 [Dermacentor silvarum]|uniref:Uncharacterized protein n=1 Tax=Dermacentor silvarum TaxID=543639 RepID=A0ACB8DFN8_DERSI|nr:hypothetical protein HPB49_019748 [Dermacentor silvarum]
MVQQHTSFEHFRPGVYLCTQYPYLAAMPDAMVKCKCCGEGVAEVKCPYTLASSVASNDPNFCLENWHRNQTLKRTHPYNFQVQAQMAFRCLADQATEHLWNVQLRNLRNLTAKSHQKVSSSVHVPEGFCLPDSVLELGPKFGRSTTAIEDEPTNPSRHT